MAELIDRKGIFFEGKETGDIKYDEGFLDGAMCVLNAIDEMPTVNQWISVKDRLPEKDQTILVYCGGFIGDMMNVYTYMGNDKWEDDYGYWETAKNGGITHWMPLPEPPKGE